MWAASWATVGEWAGDGKTPVSPTLFEAQSVENSIQIGVVIDQHSPRPGVAVDDPKPLHFRHDDSVERGMRIDRLIAGAIGENGVSASDEDGKGRDAESED